MPIPTKNYVIPNLIGNPYTICHCERKRGNLKTTSNFCNKLAILKTYSEKQIEVILEEIKAMEKEAKFEGLEEVETGIIEVTYLNNDGSIRVQEFRVREGIFYLYDDYIADEEGMEYLEEDEEEIVIERPLGQGIDYVLDDDVELMEVEPEKEIDLETIEELKTTIEETDSPEVLFDIIKKAYVADNRDLQRLVIEKFANLKSTGDWKVKQKLFKYSWVSNAVFKTFANIMYVIGIFLAAVGFVLVFWVEAVTTGVIFIVIGSISVAILILCYMIETVRCFVKKRMNKGKIRQIVSITENDLSNYVLENHGVYEYRTMVNEFVRQFARRKGQAYRNIIKTNFDFGISFRANSLSQEQVENYLIKPNKDFWGLFIMIGLIYREHFSDDQENQDDFFNRIFQVEYIPEFLIDNFKASYQRIFEAEEVNTNSFFRDLKSPENHVVLDLFMSTDSKLALTESHMLTVLKRFIPEYDIMRVLSNVDVETQNELMPIIDKINSAQITTFEVENQELQTTYPTVFARELHIPWRGDYRTDKANIGTVEAILSQINLLFSKDDDLSRKKRVYEPNDPLLLLIMEKFNILERESFLYQVNKYTEFMFPNMFKTAGKDKKLIFDLISNDIIENYDYLEGRNIDEKLVYYFDTYFSIDHLSYEDQESLVEDPITVMWMIERADVFFDDDGEFRGRFEEEDLYRLFGNTKHEAMLNLYAGAMRRGSEIYESIIKKSLRKELSYRFIDAYLDEEDLNLKKELADKIFILIDLRKLASFSGGMYDYLLENCDFSTESLYLTQNIVNKYIYFFKALLGDYSNYDFRGILGIVAAFLDGRIMADEIIKYNIVLEMLIRYYNDHLDDIPDARKAIFVELILRLLFEKEAEIAEATELGESLTARIIDKALEGLEKVTEELLNAIEAEGLREENRVGRIILERFKIIDKKFLKTRKENYPFYRQLVMTVFDTVKERCLENPNLDITKIWIVDTLKDMYLEKEDRENIEADQERILRIQEEERFKSSLQRFKSYKRSIVGEGFQKFLTSLIKFTKQAFNEYVVSRNKEELTDVLNVIEKQIKEQGLDSLDIEVIKVKAIQMPYIEEDEKFVLTRRMLRILAITYQLYGEEDFTLLMKAIIERSELLNERVALIEIVNSPSQMILNNFNRNILPRLMRLQDIKLSTLKDLIIKEEDYVPFLLQMEQDISSLCKEAGILREELLVIFPGIQQVFLEDAIFGLGNPVTVEEFEEETEEGEVISVERLIYLNGLVIDRVYIETEEEIELIDIRIKQKRAFETIELSSTEKLVYRFKKRVNGAVERVKELYMLVGGEVLELPRLIRQKFIDVIDSPVDIIQQKPILQSL